MVSCRLSLGTRRVDSGVMLGKVSSLQRSRQLKAVQPKPKIRRMGENHREGVLLGTKACRAQKGGGPQGHLGLRTKAKLAEEHGTVLITRRHCTRVYTLK